MNGIKIDAERIKNVANIWRDFNREISTDGFNRGREEVRYRIAAYLTIAYMFGAERKDDGTGLKCEVCGHQPCVLFGPQPKNCERCGGDMILQAEVKEEAHFKLYDEPGWDGKVLEIDEGWEMFLDVKLDEGEVLEVFQEIGGLRRCLNIVRWNVADDPMPVVFGSKHYLKGIKDWSKVKFRTQKRTIIEGIMGNLGDYEKEAEKDV